MYDTLPPIHQKPSLLSLAVSLTAHLFLYLGVPVYDWWVPEGEHLTIGHSECGRSIGFSRLTMTGFIAKFVHPEHLTSPSRIVVFVHGTRASTPIPQTLEAPPTPTRHDTEHAADDVAKGQNAPVQPHPNIDAAGESPKLAASHHATIMATIGTPGNIGKD